MANDSNIRSFTAADIEKYHQGLLTPRERHEMERAALEDPFLADAIEGYAVKGVDSAADLVELNRRLAKRTEESKVIPLAPHRQRSFQWWKIAALFILVAGAGVLAYQGSFNGRPHDIAQANPIKKTTDTPSTTSAPPALSAATADSASHSLEFKIKKLAIRNEEAIKDIPAPVKPALEEEASKADKNVALEENSKTVTPAATLPSPGQKEKKERALKYNLKYKTERSEAASGNSTAATLPYTPNKNKTFSSPRSEPTARQSADSGLRERSVLGDKNSNGLAQFNHTNIFRGKVTDASNNALPFANITNTRDDIGTYSDAHGNFVLVSPDSVLNVQVRSVGFENSNVLLQNQATANRVTLQEDRSLNVRILDTIKRNANRSRDANLVLEEPEPVDGWNNYDTYLVNNLNVPQQFRPRQNEGGEVEISFEVNQYGQPINIKIEKSLCDACDKEAIRLIREGPKWKRKTKKGRTVVKVGF